MKIESLVIMLVLISIMLAVSSLIFSLLPERPIDSTDQSAEQRSGMGLHIDHSTGCEYLSYPRGGLIERRSADGETHMGCFEGGGE